MREHFERRLPSLAAVAALVLSAPACAQLSEVTDGAAGDSNGSADVPGAGSGPELSTREENILNNVDDVLEDCPLDGRPYADDDLPQNQRRAVSQCEMGLDRVEGQLDNIDEESRAHPRYTEARQNVDRLGDQVASWEAELDADQEARAEASEIEEDYHTFFDREGGELLVIQKLYRTMQGESPTQYAEDHVLESRMEAAFGLDDREARCREDFDTGMDYSRYSEDDYDHPQNACAVVYDWREYMAAYLNEHARDRAASDHQELERMLEGIASEGMTTDSDRARLADLAGERDSLYAYYEELVDSIDGSLEPETTEKLDAIAELQPEYDRVLRPTGQEMRWDPSGQHQEPEVRAALAPNFSGTAHDIVAYRVADPEWRIEHDDATGNPVVRHHRGVVLTRKAGEDFCRIYDFEATGRYDGTGYTEASVGIDPESDLYVITACP